MNKKQELCKILIESGKLKKYDIIKHSYSTHRINNLDKAVEKNEEGIINTLTTRVDCLGVVMKEKKDLIIRKLTPKECWRLMGFSDEVFDKAKAVPTSDAQLYKQAGNSIVVDCLEKILKNLLIDKKEPKRDLYDMRQCKSGTDNYHKLRVETHQ